MPQNKIQFQRGMSLTSFMEQHGTEAACEAALLRARWPDGFRCPECGGREHSTFLADGRRYWQCSHCREQTTRRSGTLFHASRLPLTKWFQAIYLVTQNKNNLSALSLKRHLGVCYRTAWRLKHKLLEAMAQREATRLLEGVVLADDAVLGGVQAGKPGRGSENKAAFIAAVELDENGHPHHVRFDPIADYRGTTFRDWARRALHLDAHLVTDGCASFNAAGAEVSAHGAIIVGERKSSELEPFRWVNTTCCVRHLAPEGDGSRPQRRVWREHAVVAMAVPPGRRDQRREMVEHAGRYWARSRRHSDLSRSPG